MAEKDKSAWEPPPDQPEPPVKLYKQPTLWELLLGRRPHRPHFGVLETHVYEDDLSTLPPNRLPEKPVILTQVEEEKIVLAVLFLISCFYCTVSLYCTSTRRQTHRKRTR